MRIAFLLPLFPLALLITGCPSQDELCRSGVDQVCERSFECQPAQVQSSPQFQAAFGTSVADCKEKLYANPLRPAGATGIACADVETNEQLCTNLGAPSASDFSLSNASECRDRRDDLSCQDYLAQLQDPSLAPAVCADRCK
ncbi:MAG: hypothetical protein M3Y59_22420 [Myxococcota bacterium]|nr:hypothetical protein [Myxococcota bacterium]